MEVLVIDLGLLIGILIGLNRLSNKILVNLSCYLYISTYAYKSKALGDEQDKFDTISIQWCLNITINIDS